MLKPSVKLLGFLLVSLLLAASLNLCPQAALAEGGGTTPEGLVWTSEDGTNATVGGYTGTAEQVVIPSQIEGRNVTAIGTGALMQSAVREVVLPGTLKSIGDYAFSECRNLLNMTIPAGVKDIGENVFQLCDRLAAIAVESGSAYFASEDGVLYDAGKTRLVAYPAGKAQLSFAVPGTVTTIGSGAFSGAKALESVDIPAGVTTVGGYAFMKCLRLESITIPAGVTAVNELTFYQCAALEAVSLPVSLKTIGQSAFSGCASLASLTLPAGLTAIDMYGFYDSGLTGIDIPAGVTSIGDYVFAGCTELTAISVNAGNANYSSIGGALYSKDGTLLIQYPCGKTDPVFEIPGGVKTLANACISECANLTGVVIPPSVETQDSSISRCLKLESISLKTTSGYFAAVNGILYSKDMTTLIMYPPAKPDTSFTLPASVTALQCGFNDSSRLAAIYVEEGSTAYESRDGILCGISPEPGSNWIISYPPAKTGDSYTQPSDLVGSEPGAFANQQYLKHFTFRAETVRLDSHMFVNTHSLESVSFPDTIEAIGVCTFMNCTGLKSFTVPAGVQYIEDGAFQGCTGLTSFTIAGASAGVSAVRNASAAGLTQIGRDAFASCSALTRIQVPDTVTSIGAGAFAGCVNLAAIDVGAGNANYASAGGVLYAKGAATLIQYPAKKPGSLFVVPGTVTGILDGAFADAAYLNKVAIPESVANIGNYAFAADAASVLTIYGKAGSFAQAYANGLNIPFSTDTPKYAVTFDSKGGSAVAKAYAEPGALLPKPADPARAGYVFAGWHKDSACTVKWDFQADTVNADITLYARWNAGTLGIPAGVKAASASYSSIRVTWKPVAGAAGYEVQRSTAVAGKYTAVGRTTACAFTNGGLTTGRTYYYKVRAYRLSGSVQVYGKLSSYAYARPVPAAPAWVKAAALSYDSIRITWKAVPGATRYMLYRATSPRGTYRLLTTTSALGYTNRRVATGATYYYKVRAYRLTGGARVYGAYSATAATKTSLSAPSWAKAARASAGSVKVTWAKVAGATKYEVWRAPAAGAAFVRTAAVSGTVWVNTGLTAGNTYFYKVKAYRLVSGRKVYGGFSRVVSAKP